MTLKQLEQRNNFFNLDELFFLIENYLCPLVVLEVNTRCQVMRPLFLLEYVARRFSFIKEMWNFYHFPYTIGLYVFSHICCPFISYVFTSVRHKFCAVTWIVVIVNYLYLSPPVSVTTKCHQNGHLSHIVKCISSFIYSNLLLSNYVVWMYDCEEGCSFI